MSLVQILESEDQMGSLADLATSFIAPPAKAPKASVGFFDRILNGLSSASSLMDRSAQSLTRVADAAGRLRGKARQDAVSVEDAYQRNFRGKPQTNWFSEELIPGLPNGFLAAGIAALGLVLILKKKEPR
jgi:hypothetical protein